MTLRARLLTVTVSMAALVVLGMLMIMVNVLIVDGLTSTAEYAESTGRQVRRFLMRRIDQQTAALEEVPVTIGASKRLWKQLVANDEALAAMVNGLMSQKSSLVEINIAGDDSLILVSSNHFQARKVMTAREQIRSLLDAGPLGRFFALLKPQTDYEIRETLGITNQAPPVFTIQVLASTAFIWNSIKPAIFRALILTAIALVAAVFLAYWLTSLALRPITRVGNLIDAIVRGESVPIVEPPEGAAELAIIESKLSILGEKYRSALQIGELAVARRLIAIGSLTSRVAHEIKNPLNSIALRLELLRSRVSGESPEAEAEIAILSEEVTRLDRVVKTFLDFSRPVEPVMEPLDVNALVGQVAGFLQPQAELSGIRMEVPGPGHPVMIRGDSDLLKQAVINIAVNAIEAMKDGGRLTMAVVAGRRACQIRISDTGPGIPPDQIDRIFDLYFTTKSKGSGIGLAMTFRSVQLHGGTIGVANQDGAGAEFVIELPLAESR